MKDLLLRTRDVVRISNLKISRRRLVDHVKEIPLKCMLHYFSHSTNRIVDLWRCRCRRLFLNSLMSTLFRVRLIAQS